MIGFDLAQTFFLDRDAVQGSATAALVAVDLYFYAKPVEGKTKSNIDKPGVSVYACYTKDDGVPDDSLVFHEYAGRVEYDDINTTINTPTRVTFRRPVIVDTNRSYGLLIKFDGSDPDFKLWYNKAGDKKLGTTTDTQVTSGKVDGYFFTMTNGKVLTPQKDADLAFKLYVAKYTATEKVFKIKNRTFEIFKVSGINGIFKGGEDAYLKSANAAGNVSINASSKTLTGTGTAFNSVLVVGDKFVITDGTLGNTDVRTVTAITNSTSVTLDVAPSFTNAAGAYYKTVIGQVYFADSVADYVVLQDVNTNTTNLAVTGVLVAGVDSQATANITAITNYTMNAVVPNYYIETPSGTTATQSLNFANSSYGFSPSNLQKANLTERTLLNKYPAIVASKTNEASQSASFASFNGYLTFTTNNPYASPLVKEENLDMFGERFSINNDATDEVIGKGKALSRYVSKVVSLTEDQRAEDLRVYVRSYKPSNTSILVYAKFRNAEDNESFDVKQWTLLNAVTNGSAISNPTNIYDFVDQEYAVPFYQTTKQTANGSFVTQSSNSVIVGSSTDVNTYVTVGDLVRVYSPLFPTTYFIDKVVASNTTTLTVGTAISNSSLVGSGFKVDVLNNAKSGFLDIQSQNVLTYYNNTYAKFQGYDAFCLKVVLLSEDNIKIPYVDDIRAIAVSA